jgi:hypothetical protein
MSEDLQKEKTKTNPNNEIDFQNATTSPFISSEFMTDRVRNKFRDRVIVESEGKKEIRTVRDYWANMELFTQDLRLSNINKDESFYVRYNYDLAQDILTTLPTNFSKSALILIERSTVVLETAQSKSGFLRRMFNSFFQHTSSKEEPQTKRSFFGLGKKQKVE